MQVLAAHQATARRYTWPVRTFLVCTIALSLAATILAIVAGETVSAGESWTASPLSVAVVVLPATIIVIDSIEAVVRSFDSANAAARAAGLVAKAIYMYRTRAGQFADAVLAPKAVESKTDVMSLRQHTLTARLTTIELNTVGTVDAISMARETIMATHGAAAGESDSASGLSVDDYFCGPWVRGARRREPSKGRVGEALAATSLTEWRLLQLVVLLRIIQIVATAIGTVCGTLGYPRMVAITVSITTAVSQTLR